MKQKNIVLVGFMCSGKTVVGKSLAKKLGLKFISVDDLIEKKVGMSIPRLFARYGEKYFRRKESAALNSLRRQKGAVIATGGGIVLKEENRERLPRLGRVIWLKVNARAAASRLRRLKDRPLLHIKDPRERFRRIQMILHFRRPLYEEVADSKIDTSRKSVVSVVKTIESAIS